MSDTVLEVRLDQVDHEIKILMSTPDTAIRTMILAERGADGPRGADGVGADAAVVGETPSGAINGSNATFTTAFNFVPESVAVYVNGLNQKRVAEFNTVGTMQITLTESPGVGEIVIVNYLKGE